MEPASSDLSDMSTKTPVIPPVSIPGPPVDRSAPTNEAPKSQLPHRNEARIRRSRLLVAAAVVLVAICVGAYFAVKAITKPAPPAPFSLTGTLQLTSDSIKTTGLPGGYSCAGDRSDNDIGPGATVTVADETGKLIAKGAIESSYGQQGSCLFCSESTRFPAGRSSTECRSPNAAKPCTPRPQPKPESTCPSSALPPAQRALPHPAFQHRRQRHRKTPSRPAWPSCSGSLTKTTRSSPTGSPTTGYRDIVKTCGWGCFRRPPFRVIRRVLLV